MYNAQISGDFEASEIAFLASSFDSKFMNPKQVSTGAAYPSANGFTVLGKTTLQLPIFPKAVANADLSSSVVTVF